MALLIGMLVASFMQASAGLEAMKQFGISSQHADDLDRMHRLFLELQTVTRGYALTRDPAYLASYRETTAKIQGSLMVVQQDLRDPFRTETAELVKQAQAMAAHLTPSSRALNAESSRKKPGLTRAPSRWRPTNASTTS
jgi:protein-histidine pros-kinase